MKKQIVLGAVALVASLSLTSCNWGKTTDAEAKVDTVQPAVDTLKTEVAKDTTTATTEEAAAPQDTVTEKK